MISSLGNPALVVKKLKHDLKMTKKPYDLSTVRYASLWTASLSLLLLLVSWMSCESQMLSPKPLNLTASVFHSTDLWDGWYQFTLQIPELAAQDQRNQGSPCCSISRAIQTNVEEWRHAKVGLPSEWPSLCSFSNVFGNQLLACVDPLSLYGKFLHCFSFILIYLYILNCTTIHPHRYQWAGLASVKHCECVY